MQTDPQRKEQILWVDLTSYINESLTTQGLRGIQRVIVSLLPNFLKKNEVKFCYFRSGEFMEVPFEIVQELSELDPRDAPAFATLLGLRLVGKKGLKRVKLSPQIQAKLRNRWYGMAGERFVFWLSYAIGRNRREFLFLEENKFLPASIKTGDKFLELGLPSERQKIDAILQFKSQNIKFIFFAHDIFYLAQSYLFGNKPRQQKRMLSMLGAADLIITPTEYSRNAIIEWWPAIANGELRYTPIEVVHLSADHTTLKSSIVEQDDFELPAKPYWLSIGSIEPRKNYGVVLLGLQMMEPPENLSYIIVGSTKGATKGEKQAIDKLRAKGWDIQIVQGLSDLSLKKLLQNASLLIHPAFAEGFGLPPLEALREGVPVVLSDALAHKELYPGHHFFDRQKPSNFHKLIRTSQNIRLEEAIQSRLLLSTWASAGEKILQAAKF